MTVMKVLSFIAMMIIGIILFAILGGFAAFVLALLAVLVVNPWFWVVVLALVVIGLLNP